MNERIRNRLNIVLGAVGVIFGLLSLWAALTAGSTWIFASHEQLGSYLLAIGILLPPLYFWIDWVWFCSYMPANDENRDIAKHTHDLSRNIWLGLIAILTVLFKVAPAGIGN